MWNKTDDGGGKTESAPTETAPAEATAPAETQEPAAPAETPEPAAVNRHTAAYRLPAAREHAFTLYVAVRTGADADDARQRCAEALDGAEKAVVFAATAGLGIDRLIKTYSAQSPLKSLCFDAIGTDRAESICNLFNKEIGSLYTLCRPRFSPGYGDLDISFQKKIFDELSCPSNIGVYLSGSLQMIPTKSVTTVIGVKDENS